MLTGAPGAAAPLVLGGVLSLDEPAMARWGPAGTWRLPVGDARELGRPRTEAEPAFRLNRGLERRHGRVTHQGADLACGRAGDTVVAAASGIVVLVQNRPNGNGYGGHVVLAHRLEDGRTIYTVYAHLLRGSAGVEPGQAVVAGDPLGRVGSTGRASTPHLHFEVRAPRAPGERWENAPALDPLEFVESRLADPTIVHGALAGYVEWARHESLLAGAVRGPAPLTRGQWWPMLAAAARAENLRPGAAPAELRDALIEAGLLPEEEFGAPPAELLSWSELARDVKRLHQVGVRSPHGPLAAEAHERECEARFGERRPAAHTKALRRLAGDPTVADACLLLADLAGPREAPGAGGEGERAAKPKKARSARR